MSISSVRIVLAALAVAFALAGFGCALAGSTPPNVPHSVSGAYEDCRSCHEEGVQGAPKTDHAKKADCTSCHHPVQTAP